MHAYAFEESIRSLRRGGRLVFCGSTSGRTATAELQIADTGNYSQCFQRLPQRPGMAGLLPTAAGLRVYPPNQTASTVIPYPLRACAHTGLVLTRKERGTRS